MAANTVAIKKDVDSKAVPQYYNSSTDAYEVVQGANGASRVIVYGLDGLDIDFTQLFTNIVDQLNTEVKANIIASVLPTGAATAAKQDSIITYIDTLETLLTAIKDTAGIKKITDALPAGTNTIGAVKVAGNDTMLQGNITLTGAAQQVNANTACKVITIQAEPTNQGYVYVGKSDVSSTVHMCTLSPGSSITITCSNLNLLYVIGTASDKVCYGGEA